MTDKVCNYSRGRNRRSVNQDRFRSLVLESALGFLPPRFCYLSNYDNLNSSRDRLYLYYSTFSSSNGSFISVVRMMWLSLERFFIVKKCNQRGCQHLTLLGPRSSQLVRREAPVFSCGWRPPYHVQAAPPCRPSTSYPRQRLRC